LDNQETNPTPEQWQQQQQNRNYQQPPYNQPFSMPEEYQQQPRGSKFGGGMGAIFIAVALSLVLCYAMISFLGITPSMKQYKADITRLEMDLVDIRTVNDGQATNIGNLAGAVATANSAATKAQSALDLSNSIKTGYDTIRADVTALQAALEDIDTNGTGDVYDDAEIRGLITALQGNITTINADITALQAYDTTNTANLASISASITALQTSLSNLTTIVNNISGGEVDLSDILDDIDDINDEIVSLNTDITNLQDYDNYLLGLINSLQTQVTAISEPVIVTSFDEVHNQLIFKTNAAGNYAVILTFYGSGFVSGTGNISIPTADNVRVMDATAYASGDMMIVIIEPPLVQTGNPPVWVDTNWVAGKIVGITLTVGDLQYVTIETASR
jgi:hypothetical protein